ncbi:MAG: M23 family metallopeptidase [bacterium]|nr:M23 family metallopeptidase [bacterium]
MKNKVSISIIFTVILLSASIFLLGFNNASATYPEEVYQVYLDGEVIGTIKSKEKFENYINNEQATLKEKYQVDAIYAPKGVEIKKLVTYNPKLIDEITLYQQLKQKKPFTVKGTVITIKKPKTEDDSQVEEQYINVLDKEIFDDALTKTIKGFVGAENYEKFLSATQEEIKDVGSIIENIYMQETVTYKEDLISTDSTIFTQEDELAKYLLFGTTEEQSKYIIEEGDTIETVANKNKLSVEEFLIANPKFNSVNNLLYTSQEVVVGLINPIINIVSEEHVIETKVKNYTTEVQYDSNLAVGIENEIRAGEDGLYKVTEKVQYINGQLVQVYIVNSTELKPAVNKIIVKGEKIIPHIADESFWAWPTITPYQITSGYAYRWGSFHDAIDIAGVGYGSPAYAANNATVYKTEYGHSSMGNYIILNHNTGKYTIYMHLKDIYVKTGQIVSRGQVIGSVGNTGNVSPRPSASNPYAGTHLHFGVYVGGPPYGGGYSINPLSIY